ncbi:MAG: hypothetical protein E5W94_28680, partial [Mesorhizobium sp.]
MRPPRSTPPSSLAGTFSATAEFWSWSFETRRHTLKLENHDESEQGPRRQRQPGKPLSSEHSRGDGDGADDYWTFVGFYEHELQRTPDGWKITLMRANKLFDLRNPDLPRLASARVKAARSQPSRDIEGEARMRRSICCLIAVMAASSAAFAEDRTTPGNHYVPADDIPWVGEAGAPVELGALWGDRTLGEAGTLLRTPARFRSGLHSHTADYWAIVVQGTWEHWVPYTSEGTG